MTRTCSDKVYSVPFLPCSNFQSSGMFEGSECVEVEGGSTQSTVASSISACKKVRKETELSLMCLCWDGSAHLPVCPCKYGRLSTTSSFCHFLRSCACAPVHHIRLSRYLLVCLSGRARDFHFLPRGACDTQGLCNKRPSGQPSTFIISQCH